MALIFAVQLVSFFQWEGLKLVQVVIKYQVLDFYFSFQKSVHN